jgi:hypothetical protein
MSVVTLLTFALITGMGIFMLVSSIAIPLAQQARLKSGEAGTHVGSAMDMDILRSLMADLGSRFQRKDEGDLALMLLRSGNIYKSEAEYHGRKVYGALIFALVFGAVGLVANLGFAAVALLATAGALLGFSAPSRAVHKGIEQRSKRIEREMGFAVERFSLLLAAGKNYKQALIGCEDIGLFGKLMARVGSLVSGQEIIENAFGQVEPYFPKINAYEEFKLLVKDTAQKAETSIPALRALADSLRQKLELEIMYTSEQAKLQLVLISSGFLLIASLIVIVAPSLIMLSESGVM